MYRPQVSWQTIVNDVVMLGDTTYTLLVYPLDVNDPGGAIADVVIGYYLKDFIGNSYEITGINVGGNSQRIQVEDTLEHMIGPQTGQPAVVYESVGEGLAPYIAPVRHKRIDESALDESRGVELDVAWKHRGFREETNDKDNITAVVLGSNIVSSIVENNGWKGGHKLNLTVADSDNYQYWKIFGGGVQEAILVNRGALYNGHVVADARNIAAVGWSVPTNAKWQQLSDFIIADTGCGIYVSGGYLKEIGTVNWTTPNTAATDLYGFKALPIAERSQTGVFSSFGVRSLITASDTDQVGGNDRRGIVLMYNSASFGFGYSYDMKIGSSIRLLKDDDVLEPYVGNDGKIYPTVKIGNQVWMSVNLAETKFRTGAWIHGFDDGVYTPISNSNWAALTTEAMCFLNDSEANAYTDYSIRVHSHDLVKFKDTATIEWDITELSPDNIIAEASVKSGLFPTLIKHSYTVFISQTGVGAPTESVVLVNEIGEIVWTRVSAGIYRATLVGAFVENHTAPLDDIMMDQLWNLYTLNWISADVMELKTYAAADITVLADDVLVNRYINFEVYL